ncbi:YbaB/EbfC family DNA-binding protein [Nonomuraea sp. NPDC049607]|uniref:YbaB/EbfC family DNA-binding protein n=1 Tax=unclassified Nonomuraea TaxID=2593643 RepID=UPI003413430D
MADFGDLGDIDMDRLLNNMDEQLSKSEELQKAMSALVGRGEDDGHLILVEYGQEGLRTLDIQPKAMRLSAVELSERIKVAVDLATVDLQRQADALLTQMFGESGNPMRMLENPDQALRQIRKAEASYERAFESTMQEFDRIRRELDL